MNDKQPLIDFVEIGHQLIRVVIELIRLAAMGVVVWAAAKYVGVI